MRNLTNLTVIRPAQAISQKKVDQFGFKTHPNGIISNRYKQWISLCDAKEYDTLEKEIKGFLDSRDTITSTKQLPRDFQELVEWATYEGFDFDINTFASKINFKKIWNEFGKEIKEGFFNPDTNYFKARTNLGDQLVGNVLVKSRQAIDFQIPDVIKTLDLIKDIYTRGRENLQIDIRKHYEKDMVLDICLFDFLKCRHKSNSKPLITADGAIQKDKQCNCQEEPHTDPCECKCSEECVSQNPCCAEITPYMSELFVVKDELVCYEPGEISYIENVMKSEIRERTHRQLLREETYSEIEEETNTYEERDQQVDERFSLQKEIDKVVEQDIGVNAGATYSNKKSGIFISSNLNAYANASYQQARRDAKRTVQDESKNIITRAISRVEKKLKTQSSVRLLNEMEETTRHKFKNNHSDATDISRQFYFVNQVRKAQVYSYGYRMILDFMVFEPAELLKRLLEEGFDRKKPKKPCINIEEIGTSEKDWLRYVQCYGFSDLEKINTEPQIVKVNISGDTPRMERKKDLDRNPVPSYYPFIIPSGYVAKAMKIDGFSSTHRDEEFWSKVIISNGSANVNIEHSGEDNNGNVVNWWTADQKKPYDDLNNLEGENTLDVLNFHTTTYNIQVHIICEVHPDTILSWQLEVYNRIMAKYENELAEYENAKAEYELRRQNKFNQNPFILSNMMKKQLKQAAINYISCQFFDENNVIKNRVEPCGFPQMDLKEAKREGEFVRFFEQAFEWQFMNYMLYPYFYARKCSWADKLKEEASNGLFAEFLESGAARISIPVCPNFEGYVTTYLINRQISPYSIPLIPQNLVPIHEEIKEMKQNFNTDRDGHIIHDTNTPGLSLGPNEIVLRNNLDYFTSSVFDQTEADKDKDREIFINCNRYRILSIRLDSTTNEIILTLGRPFEEEQNKQWEWSTGAVFVGSAWMFKVPTKLVWLREEEGCLPCYPIECDDYNNSSNS